MRALFTQLSLMVGLLTTLNMHAKMPLVQSLLFGFSAACAVYLTLLLGDSIVHRLLEDRTDRVSSVVFLDTPPELDDERTESVRENREETGARAA
jgi:hypothetical protein